MLFQFHLSVRRLLLLLLLRLLLLSSYAEVYSRAIENQSKQA
jgi:hypothetical protein